MSILKKEYELSIWNEELNSEGVKTEKKGMVIGAHDMEYLGRATNIKLKREIKGTNTLTFDMPVKYFDSRFGEYIKNEFIDDLYNEQKLKLKYDDKWYEFYIKSISEKKEFKSIMKSFTCQDSFIDELSRTGYEILVDEELYNSVDEITPFMEEILEDSIWDYRADFNWGDFTEFKEERFYKIPLKQFGGSIKGYPIKLKVETSALKSKDLSNKTDEEKENILTIKNIYTNEKRQLELGDDLSHQYEIFWDSHRSSNGFDLLSESAEELEGDYIYVPYSDLSFIYGSVYEDPYKSTEEPAIYGAYGEEAKGFALQPTSKDPTDFIQFIYFKENDKVLIDETGTIANNDCHYLISIEDWNNLLKSHFQNDKHSAIHWTSPLMNEENGITLTSKYKVEGTNIKYTTNVMPNSSTIDDFTWYPVYYEEYLSEIGDTEVFAARKISITDRTEFNLKNKYYTTIYKNNWEEYKELYSEEVPECDEDFRVQSMEETRIVTPTLARNLITNGTSITTDDGWESLIQNNQTEYNTGSYANLLEISVKSTTQNETDYQPSGDVVDEEISDYYLELLSPSIENCNNFSAEGETVGDYALNFGLTELENGIEKDKIYAIRICTGAWDITDYTIVLRKEIDSGTTLTPIKTNKEQVDFYYDALKTYNDALLNNPINLTIDNTREEFKALLKSWITEHDKVLSEDFSKWENVYIEADYEFLIGRVANIENEDGKIESITTEEYPIPTSDMYETWASNCIFENKIFTKKYNQDLDKILIGQGSIDINGNYQLSGAEKGDDINKYIRFSDVFEQLHNNLQYVGRNDDISQTTNKTELLTKTWYHNKENNNWNWSLKSTEESVEDNAFLLFKAKENISSPYLGLYCESEPLEVLVENCQITTYGETDYKGVKIEAKSENAEDGREYFVDNAQYKIYIVDNNNFSDSFLEKLGLEVGDNLEAESAKNTSLEQCDLEDGELLSGAKPEWTGTSSSSLPLFFRNLRDNEEKTASIMYALFVNDIYYGVLYLDRIQNEEEGDIENG